MEKHIKWVEVKSSNIKQIRYSHETRILQIEFHHGGIYSYTPVTEEGYQELLKAESYGDYFAKHIRSNPHITAVRVEEGKDNE